MKGRRRARQLALQALYEIDQSRHAPELVIAGRIDDLYRSGARNGVAADDWPVAEGLIDRFAASGFDAVDARAEASRLTVAPQRFQPILTLLLELQKQAEYGAEIVRGVGRNRAEIDTAIGRIAPEWPVEQMAPLDRNVLRIALWEISRGRVPVRVAINEAVELARRFSGEGSRRLVNGALGTFVAAGAGIDLSPDGSELPAEPAETMGGEPPPAAQHRRSAG